MGDTLAEFLHKKAGSSLWYYRRRYPKDVASVLGKAIHMQSLKTANKREAERLSRSVSVQFDAICNEARLRHELALAGAAGSQVPGGVGFGASANPEAVLSDIPDLVRQAASRVIEEQRSNPRGWLNVVKGWKSFYEAMKVGAVPNEAQRLAVEAQAILNGIDLVIQGKPIPTVESVGDQLNDLGNSSRGGESWASICSRALEIYRDRVSASRHLLAKKCLQEVNVSSNALSHVEAGLLEWCRGRLSEVTPRTVKTQLDCMASALRCALPNLQTPRLKELQGVMQPRNDDRQSMPVQEICKAIEKFRMRPASAKVRKDYGGGAAQFDAIAVKTLAVLGMRPRELMQAKSDAIIEKSDVFGAKGLYFRIVAGKNKASERDIPIGDETRIVLDIDKLRAMLVWQESNPRSLHGAVSSMCSRFKKMTNGYTLYQMRHSWKDIAVSVGVDFELRERLLGHRVRGVAAVYGSGIPLVKGLDVLMLISKKLGIDPNVTSQ